MADNEKDLKEFDGMSQRVLNRLIKYLKSVERFTDSQIVALLEHISE